MRFNDMNGRLGVIYNGLWGDGKFPKNLNIESNTSAKNTTYKIAGKKGEECDAIIKAFSIKNEALFKDQYRKAVRGNGHEEAKILTLHSSSRCSLLCFYGMDSEHTLWLNIDGRDIEFDYSTFELKNPVLGYPSNMDVVLLSKDRNTVLFLESKFSEYYISAAKQSSHISQRYKEYKYSKAFYDKEWLNEIEIELTDIRKTIIVNGKSKTKNEFVLSTINGSNVYLDGFKQMISHYIGIRRRLDKDALKDDCENTDARTVLEVIEKKESRVYLGEILFDNFSVPEGYEKEFLPELALKDYSSLYCKLAARMNEMIAKDNLGEKFRVVSEDFKYSEILRANTWIEEETLAFYKKGV